MTDSDRKRSHITAGVDTHKDTHTAAVLDATGNLLGALVHGSSIPE